MRRRKIFTVLAIASLFVIFVGKCIISFWYKEEIRFSPIYYQVDGNWHKYFSDNSRMRVELPDKFELLTILNARSTENWIGIMSDDTEKKCLVEYKPNEKEIDIILDGDFLKNQGINIDEIEQVQYQPETYSYCFVYGDIFFHYDKESQLLKKVCDNVLKLKNGTIGYSVLWKDKDTLFYIDNSTNSIVEFGVNTGEKKKLYNNVITINGIDQMGEQLYFSTINRYEFLAYNIWIALNSYNCKDYTTHEILHLDGNERVIGISPEEGLVLVWKSGNMKENKYYLANYSFKIFPSVDIQIEVEPKQIIYP